jgi:hypothetical protein
MFHFVTVNHPSEVKDQGRQAGLRQHAIRSGLRSKKALNAKRNDNFVAMEIDARTGKPKKISHGKDVTRVSRPIDADLLDPFDALYGSGKPLRTFMLHSKRGYWQKAQSTNVGQSLKHLPIKSIPARQRLGESSPMA